MHLDRKAASLVQEEQRLSRKGKRPAYWEESLPAVLASYCCSPTGAPTQWLQTKQVYCLTVLEVRSKTDRNELKASVCNAGTFLGSLGNNPFFCFF